MTAFRDHDVHHHLGVWAWSQRPPTDPMGRFVTEVVGSLRLKGAPLHGAVWAAVFEWSRDHGRGVAWDRSAAAQARLWSQVLQVCWWRDAHPGLFVHCLHGFGHGVWMLAATAGELSDYRSGTSGHPAPGSAAYRNSSTAEEPALRLALDICEAARRVGADAALHQASNLMYACANGVYMEYWKGRWEAPMARFLNGTAVATILRGGHDALDACTPTPCVAGMLRRYMDRLPWVRTCDVARFAAPCYRYLAPSHPVVRAMPGYEFHSRRAAQVDLWSLIPPRLASAAGGSERGGDSGDSGDAASGGGGERVGEGLSPPVVRIAGAVVEEAVRVWQRESEARRRFDALGPAGQIDAQLAYSGCDSTISLGSRGALRERGTRGRRDGATEGGTEGGTGRHRTEAAANEPPAHD